MGAEDPRDQHDSAPEAATEEAVGYGKPPRHSRFKPGRSGNPRGRPKGAASCKTLVARVALQEHEVLEHGKLRRRTTLELVLQVLNWAAAQGDPKALAELNDLLEKFGPREFKATGAYIFMAEVLPAEEQQAESERVKTLEQQRMQAWQPKGR